MQPVLSPAPSRAPHGLPHDLSREAETIQLRSEIDRIDDLLLELVNKRLKRSEEIALCKGDAREGELLIRPDRERQVLERLQSKAAPAARDAVPGLWRELMGRCLQAQQPSTIVLHAAQDPVLVTDRARLRFGCAAPLLAAVDADSALQHARLHPAIAVIELSPLSSWWVSLHDARDLLIFDGIKDASGRTIALAVGRVPSRYRSPTCPTYSILSEERLRLRMASGEAIRPLALSGRLRLCVAEAPNPGGES